MGPTISKQLSTAPAHWGTLVLIRGMRGPQPPAPHARPGAAWRLRGILGAELGQGMCWSATWLVCSGSGSPCLRRSSSPSRPSCQASAP